MTALVEKSKAAERIKDRLQGSVLFGVQDPGSERSRHETRYKRTPALIMDDSDLRNYLLSLTLSKPELVVDAVLRGDPTPVAQTTPDGPAVDGRHAPARARGGGESASSNGAGGASSPSRSGVPQPYSIEVYPGIVQNDRQTFAMGPPFACHENLQHERMVGPITDVNELEHIVTLEAAKTSGVALHPTKKTMYIMSRDARQGNVDPKLTVATAIRSQYDVLNQYRHNPATGRMTLFVAVHTASEEDVGSGSGGGGGSSDRGHKRGGSSAPTAPGKIWRGQPRDADLGSAPNMESLTLVTQRATDLHHRFNKRDTQAINKHVAHIFSTRQSLQFLGGANQCWPSPEFELSVTGSVGGPVGAAVTVTGAASASAAAYAVPQGWQSNLPPNNPPNVPNLPPGPPPWAPAAPPPLPHGWSEVKVDGGVFYHNHLTGVSSWEKPTPPLPPGPPPPGVAIAGVAPPAGASTTTAAPAPIG